MEAKQIHIYHAVVRENQLDNWFFIRALVCPGHLNTMSTSEYLISETDCLITSVLDTLEVISAEYHNADCNHIFVHNLAAEYEDVLLPSLVSLNVITSASGNSM